MPDCPKENIEAEMHANNDNNFVDKSIHFMPLRSADAAKPAAHTPPTIIKLHALLVESQYFHFFICQ